MVWGLGFEVLGFKRSGFWGFRDLGVGFRVWGLGVRV